jgi:cytochrome c-type biogenesis protein CcmH
MTRFAAFLLLTALALACRPAPSPPPESRPPASASPGGLRPLTSRDGGGSESPPAARAPAVPVPDADGVSGTVAVAASLAGRVQPTDVLYLIARSAKTGGVVAVRREDGVRFPFAFALGPSDVMVEGTPFEGPFDLTARLSKTGDAVAAKGDLEGSAGTVAAGSSRVAITLDRVRQ